MPVVKETFWGHHVTRRSPLRHLVNGRNLKSHVVPFFILSSRLQSYCLYPISYRHRRHSTSEPSHKLVYYFILLFFFTLFLSLILLSLGQEMCRPWEFPFPNGRKCRNTKKKTRGTNHSRTIEPPTTRGEPGGKRETADLQCVIKRQFDCRLRRLEPDTFVS